MQPEIQKTQPSIGPFLFEHHVTVILGIPKSPESH